MKNENEIKRMHVINKFENKNESKKLTKSKKEKITNTSVLQKL